LLILGRPLRHHQRAQLRVRNQHPMEANQVQPGPWHERVKGALQSPVPPAAA
jgi:hypothetical protein